MKNGIIKEMFNEENGVIIDEDNKEYYFSKVNCNTENIKTGDNVLFEFIIIETYCEYPICKAINIEKI